MGGFGGFLGWVGVGLGEAFGLGDGFGFGGGGVGVLSVLRGIEGLEVVAFELDGVGVWCFAGGLAGGVGFGAWRFHGDFFLDGVVELAGHLFELFDAGELVDVLEAEAEEEVLGGFVEDGAADDLLAAGGGDELAGEERAEDAGGVDAADLGDFGGGDGLLVGDDGEGFEGLEGEL